MIVAFDTNVLIDAITSRNDYESAQQLIMAIANDRITGVITANSITDIHYILKKRLGDAKAREAIWNLFTVFEVAEVNAEICSTALGLPMKDFEDAVLAVCAKEYGAEVIVTGDVGLLEEKNAPLRTATAKSILDILAGTETDK